VGPDGHCYEQFSETSPWQAAEAACMAWGGHLAALTSMEEYDFVLNVITATDDKNDDTWIGATDPAPVDGVFEWTTGEPWGDDGWAVGAPPWKPGNPKAEEDCIKIHDGFESAPCDSSPPKGYLCERAG
jgi:hypothetical protein